MVRNPGPETLDTIAINDVFASGCSRNSTEVQSMLYGVGNRDGRFDIGEVLTYTCTIPGVETYTFPNNENRICVNGRGITSGIQTTSCDETRVFTNTPNVCSSIQVSQNGNQISATCGPQGSYRMIILQN